MIFHNNIQLTKLAGELDELQRVENNGQGIERVRYITLKMRQGNQEIAELTFRNEADKIRQYPAVYDRLVEIFPN